MPQEDEKGSFRCAKALVIILKQRILTAIVGIPLVVVVLLFSHTLVLPIVIALCAAVGVVEMLGCIGVKKKLAVSIPSVLLSLATPFFARYGVLAFQKSSYVMAVFAAVSFVYMFYLMALAVVSKGTKSISDMALTAITTVYIVFGFSSIILLRDIRMNGVDIGVWLFALVFVGAWVPDGAGYFCGRAFGKHKLIPDVSPKKTVEGAIGGIVFGGLSFAVCGLIADLSGAAKPLYIQLAVSGLIIAVVSIFGDLIASLIKRQYGIKDYGKLFPGHGGVMDRFDSIIAIAPFLMMVCSHPDIFALFG